MINIGLDHESCLSVYKVIQALTDCICLLLMLFTCKSAPTCHRRPRSEAHVSGNTPA